MENNETIKIRQSKNGASKRIHTEIGESASPCITVQLNQSFDAFEILSLKLTQENIYQLHQSDYGVIVGRVNASGNFGVPNVKISVFIASDNTEDSIKAALYPYATVSGEDENGKRYNLLPEEAIYECHQAVGTFPSKRLVLDDNNVLEIFDKYYKYTTRTNESGDYMLFGIPSGQQTLHMEVDLSDIGILSQTPADMIYQGYNINQFDSAVQFKKSDDLSTLVQIKTQDKGVYVYPFWGDTTMDEGETIGITRCDFDIPYEFHPTCIFMGSAITDKGSNYLGKRCQGTKDMGRVSEMTTTSGTIEMIRKMPNGLVEDFQIKGNKLIDGDGVWCYQIPMNLDYMMTDEYGNMVPTDDITKGIPTRARVRFRFTLDEMGDEDIATKRARFLVPNNTMGAPNYTFGTFTKDSDFRDLLWNNVYSVKSYIPRVQRWSASAAYRNNKFLGFKASNHAGDNNPLPYNSLHLSLGLTSRLICRLMCLLIDIVARLNSAASSLSSWGIHKAARAMTIVLDGSLWGDEGKAYFISSGYIHNKSGDANVVGPALVRFKKDSDIDINDNSNIIFICDSGNPPSNYDNGKNVFHNASEGGIQEIKAKIQTHLVEEYEASSFNFANDWLNGVLYFPLWYKKIRKRRRGNIEKYCNVDSTFSWANIIRNGVLSHTNNGILTDFRIGSVWKTTVQENIQKLDLDSGIIKVVEVNKKSYEENGVTNYVSKKAYYYAPSKNYFRLMSTDIILLGNINENNFDGIPQFFSKLTSSTYRIQPNVIEREHDDEDSISPTNYALYTGCDWSISKSPERYSTDAVTTKKEFQKASIEGGLFYGVSCSAVDTRGKSFANASRICELGVTLDQLTDPIKSDKDPIFADGYISYDDIENSDIRAMFATMNSTRLIGVFDTKKHRYRYDFTYLYPDGFDGELQDFMKTELGGHENADSHPLFRYNGNLELVNKDYNKFRFNSNNPVYYDSKGYFPKYTNSFYFYFGLKYGKTALDKFRELFYADCETEGLEDSYVGIIVGPNSWAKNVEGVANRDGYMIFNTDYINKPITVIIYNKETKQQVAYEDISANFYVATQKADANNEIFKNLDHKQIDSTFFVNGNYTIQVTDCNFLNYSYDVAMIKEKSETEVDALNFTSDTYTNIDNYVTVAGDETDIRPYDKVRDIGGVLQITAAYNNSDTVCDISIYLEGEETPRLECTVIKTAQTSCTYTLKSQGSPYIKNYHGVLYFGVGMIGNYIIKADYGNGDVSSYQINVLGATPTTFYINGIDYELIKDITNKESKDGWERLADIKSLVPYLSFPKDDKEFSSSAELALSNLKKYITSTIASIVNGFTITTPNGTKDVEVTVIAKDINQRFRTFMLPYDEDSIETSYYPNLASGRTYNYASGAVNERAANKLELAAITIGGLRIPDDGNSIFAFKNGSKRTNYYEANKTYFNSGDKFAICLPERAEQTMLYALNSETTKQGLIICSHCSFISDSSKFTYKIDEKSNVTEKMKGTMTKSVLLNSLETSVFKAKSSLNDLLEKSIYNWNTDKTFQALYNAIPTDVLNTIKLNDISKEDTLSWSSIELQDSEIYTVNTLPDAIAANQGDLFKVVNGTDKGVYFKIKNELLYVSENTNANSAKVVNNNLYFFITDNSQTANIEDAIDSFEDFCYVPITYNKFNGCYGMLAKDDSYTNFTSSYTVMLGNKKYSWAKEDNIDLDNEWYVYYDTAEKKFAIEVNTSYDCFYGDNNSFAKQFKTISSASSIITPLSCIQTILKHANQYYGNNKYVEALTPWERYTGAITKPFGSSSVSGFSIAMYNEENGNINYSNFYNVGKLEDLLSFSIAFNSTELSYYISCSEDFYCINGTSLPDYNDSTQWGNKQKKHILGINNIEDGICCKINGTRYLVPLEYINVGSFIFGITYDNSEVTLSMLNSVLIYVGELADGYNSGLKTYQYIGNGNSGVTILSNGTYKGELFKDKHEYTNKQLAIYVIDTSKKLMGDVNANADYTNLSDTGRNAYYWIISDEEAFEKPIILTIKKAFSIEA